MSAAANGNESALDRATRLHREATNALADARARGNAIEIREADKLATIRLRELLAAASGRGGAGGGRGVGALGVVPPRPVRAKAVDGTRVVVVSEDSTRVAELQAQVARLEATLNTSRTESETLRRAIEQLQAAAAANRQIGGDVTLNNRVRDLEANNQSLLSNIGELERQLVLAKDQLTTAQRRLRRRQRPDRDAPSAPVVMPDDQRNRDDVAGVPPPLDSSLVIDDDDGDDDNADGDTFLQRFGRFLGLGGTPELGDAATWGADTSTEAADMQSAIGNGSESALAAYLESKFSRVLARIDQPSDTQNVAADRAQLERAIVQLTDHMRDMRQAELEAAIGTVSIDSLLDTLLRSGVFLMAKLATGREFLTADVTRAISDEEGEGGSLRQVQSMKPPAYDEGLAQALPWTTSTRRAQTPDGVNNQLLIGDELPLDKKLAARFGDFLAAYAGRRTTIEQLAAAALAAAPNSTRPATERLLDAWYPEAFRNGALQLDADGRVVAAARRRLPTLPGRSAESRFGLASQAVAELQRVLDANSAGAARRSAVQLLFYTPFALGRETTALDFEVPTGGQTTLFRALARRPLLAFADDTERFLVSAKRAAALGGDEYAVSELGFSSAIPNPDKATRDLIADGSVSELLQKWASKNVATRKLYARKVYAYAERIGQNDVLEALRANKRFMESAGKSKQFSGVMRTFAATKRAPERMLIAKRAFVEAHRLGAEAYEALGAEASAEFVRSAAVAEEGGVRRMSALELAALDDSVRGVVEALGAASSIDDVHFKSAVMTAAALGSMRLARVLTAVDAGVANDDALWQHAELWSPDDTLGSVFAARSDANMPQTANELVRQLQALEAKGVAIDSAQSRSLIRLYTNTAFQRRGSVDVLVPVDDYLRTRGTSLVKVMGRNELQQALNDGKEFASDQITVNQKGAATRAGKVVKELETILSRSGATAVATASDDVAVSRGHGGQSKLTLGDLQRRWDSQTSGLSVRAFAQELANNKILSMPAGTPLQLYVAYVPDSFLSSLGASKFRASPSAPAFSGLIFTDDGRTQLYPEGTDFAPVKELGGKKVTFGKTGVEYDEKQCGRVGKKSDAISLCVVGISSNAKRGGDAGAARRRGVRSAAVDVLEPIELDTEKSAAEPATAPAAAAAASVDEATFAAMVELTTSLVRSAQTDSLGEMAMQKMHEWLDTSSEHVSARIGRSAWDAGIASMRDVLDDVGLGTDDAESAQSLAAFDLRYDAF